MFTTEKAGKNRTNTIKNGEFVCQLLNKEVRSWLFRAERAVVEAEEDRIAEIAIRTENVKAYLAARSNRPVNNEIQLELF